MSKATKIRISLSFPHLTAVAALSFPRFAFSFYREAKFLGLVENCLGRPLELIGDGFQGFRFRQLDQLTVFLH